MDKIIDIKKILEKTAVEVDEKTVNEPPVKLQKSTNPIVKKLAKFKNDNLSKKFDINDLLR